MLRRDDWLDLARKVDWTFRFVEEDDVFPEAMSGAPWLPHDAWREWNEAYRTTYREYVRNQRAKDDSVAGVRSALSKARLIEALDPGWLQLVKFHNGALALAEYAGAVAEARMARFGRDSAWRTMATLGSLDEVRHTQIPLLLGHELLRFDGNFDWTHKAFHTNEWVMIAARHLFDDMFLAADAIDTAVQLNFVFETGFTNLQFLAMAALADRADHHLFEKALASIQTDEARHAQIGHPVLRTLLANGGRERAQYLVDKMWWRCWRLLIGLTGTAMEYLTPLEARRQSFKEFMEEWVIDQFTKNLAELDLELPWFWDQFLDELDYSHHSFQLGLYAYRTTLWFDVAMPDERERAWLVEKYPTWIETYGPLWDRLELAWSRGGEADTLASCLPALCNLCQLPTLFVRPQRNTACTAEFGGRKYLFCSEPCRWIFTREPGRFASHQSVVDRIVAGVAPGGLSDLHRWMGLDAPTETGKDLRRGLDPWRLNPVPRG
ncbi:MAG TPA: YHS domain-containing protein [Acidimicrobiales bacterium]|nr:YHS domain-containing protein [Acidimicrobiales bacterium]